MNKQYRKYIIMFRVQNLREHIVEMTGKYQHITDKRILSASCTQC